MNRSPRPPRQVAALRVAGSILLAGLLLILLGLTVNTDPLPFAELVGIAGGIVSVLGGLTVAYLLAREEW